jgi:hypothetical protein
MKLSELEVIYEGGIRELTAYVAESDAKRAAMVAGIAEAKRILGMALENVNVDHITIAESVLDMDGTPGGMDSPSAIRDAIQCLANRKESMRQTRYGCKSYDRWSDQRCDMEYGYGPSHGSIRFSIGLRQDARKRDLTDAETDACIYLLEMLAAGKYKMPEGR